MHDKFAVFDGSLVVTGSYEWTVSADCYNFENAVFVTEQPVVGPFDQEFDRICNQAR